MSPRHHRRSTVDEANAAPRGILLLPIELLTEVLQYLPPTELRRAASLSRSLRVAARHAGLCSFRAFRWEVGAPWATEPSAMTEFVTYAAENDLRIHLEFKCVIPAWHAVDSEVVSEARTTLSRFVAAIATAMPCLVSLDLAVPVWCWAELDPALCTPAPRLREFLFNGRLGGTGDRLFAFPVSGDLFSGEAPMLRDVILALDNATLPRRSAPAFARVRNLQLFHRTGTAFPSFSIARHFPALSSLGIKNARGPFNLDLPFSGISLRELSMCDCWDDTILDTIKGKIRLEDVPVVRYVGPRTPDLLEPLWKTSPRSLCIRARAVGYDEEYFAFLVEPRDKGWSRSFYTSRCNWSHRRALVPIFRLELFAANMAYFRADTRFIFSFLRSNASFPALRKLQLDVRSRDDYVDELCRGCWAADRFDLHSGLCRGCLAAKCTDSDFCVSCPALEVVTFFALDRSATVQSVEAAHLGHSLGQQARPKEARARLVLSGATFVEPVAMSLLAMAFSSVEQRSFAEPSASDDTDYYVPWSY